METFQKRVQDVASPSKATRCTTWKLWRHCSSFGADRTPCVPLWERAAASTSSCHANASPWHRFLDDYFFLVPILVGPVCCVRRRLTAWTAPFVVYCEGKQWKVTDKGTFVQRDRWSRMDWQTKRAYKWLRRDRLWRMMRAVGEWGGLVAAAATLDLISRAFLLMKVLWTDWQKSAFGEEGRAEQNDEWFLNSCLIYLIYLEYVKCASYFFTFSLIYNVPGTPRGCFFPQMCPGKTGHLVTLT